MTGSLCDARPKKGEEVRLVRPVVAMRGDDLVRIPDGTLGTVTSSGDCYLFARFAHGEMELFEWEYERA